MAKFAEVIQCLRHGGTAARQAWDVSGNKEIMMQIPQRIAKDIVPKMTSVQDIVKPKIGTVGSGEIEYHHQVLIIEFKDDRTDTVKEKTVVGNHQQRLASSAEVAFEPLYHFEVEMIGGLIEYQQIWLCEQHVGQRHTLLLSA